MRRRSFTLQIGYIQISIERESLNSDPVVQWFCCDVLLFVGSSIVKNFPELHLVNDFDIVSTCNMIPFLAACVLLICKLSQSYQMIPPEDRYMDKHNSCDILSTRSFLLSSPRTSINHYIRARNLIYSEWCSKGSQLNYEEKYRAHVTQCSFTDNRASDPEGTTSETQQGQFPIDQQLLNCESRFPENEIESTVVLKLLPGETLGADKLPVNPWGSWGSNPEAMHLDLFRFWLSLRLPHAMYIDNEARLRSNIPGSYATNSSVGYTIVPPPTSIPSYIALLLPEAACTEAKLGQVPFIVNSTTLKTRLDGGALKEAITFLQALSDALAPMLMVGCNEGYLSTSLSAALTQAKFPRVSAVVYPPPRELFINVLNDTALEPSLRRNNCTNSLFHQYAEDFQLLVRRSMPVKEDFYEPTQYLAELMLDLRKKAVREDEPKIAHHICLLTHQTKFSPRDEHGVIYRMQSNYMRRLIVRLAAPLVLTTGFTLRSEEDPYIPIQFDKDSLSGQLRYIHSECAVLIGLQGPELINLLGLRKGTSVIELTQQGVFNKFYKNLAATMDDTTYDTFEIPRNVSAGEPFNEDLQQRGLNVSEHHLYITRMGLEQVVALAQRRLEESVMTQQNLNG